MKLIENDFLKTPKSLTTTIHFFQKQLNQQQQLNLSTPSSWNDINNNT